MKGNGNILWIPSMLKGFVIITGARNGTSITEW